MVAENKKREASGATELEEIQKCLVSFMSGTKPPAQGIASSVQATSPTTAAATAATQLQGIIRRGRGSA